MNNPDFLIIGASRSGTTSLFWYLVNHPDIWMSRVKEIHYFDLNYHKGLEWYAQYFRSGYINGEASPYYLVHPEVPERVRISCPDVKLIALLRNPVDRAYSHYQIAVRKQKDELEFLDALAAEEERLSGPTPWIYKPKSFRTYTYITRGLYAQQLTRWLRYFPKEQFCVIKSEDLFNTTEEIVARISEFIGIKEPPVFRPTAHNKQRYAPLSDEQREKAARYFVEDEKKLHKEWGITWNLF